MANSYLKPSIGFRLMIWRSVAFGQTADESSCSGRFRCRSPEGASTSKTDLIGHECLLGVHGIALQTSISIRWGEVLRLNQRGRDRLLLMGFFRTRV
jgi:hypothetical protein